MSGILKMFTFKKNIMGVGHHIYQMYALINDKAYSCLLSQIHCLSLPSWLIDHDHPYLPEPHVVIYSSNHHCH